MAKTYRERGLYGKTSYLLKRAERVAGKQAKQKAHPAPSKRDLITEALDAREVFHG